MVWIASARRIATLSLVFAGILSAQAPKQTTLPPTNPTGMPAPSNPIPTAAPSPQPDPLAPAQITFASGKLQVIANSSSMNEILRRIARLTSITITGGVSDERVYGTYGPAAPGDVLGSLLDGTATNMLYRESTATRPGELILTPRNGGASPPNPNAQGFDNGVNTGLQQRSPYSPVSPNLPPPLPPPPSTNEPNSPPGTRTPNGPQSPETVYQQLQRIQQAQHHP